jgi:hypothetical protein
MNAAAAIAMHGSSAPSDADAVATPSSANGAGDADAAAALASALPSVESVNSSQRADGESGEAPPHAGGSSVATPAPPGALAPGALALGARDLHAA